jgi:DnaJ-class molecular chaperone
MIFDEVVATIRCFPCGGSGANPTKDTDTTTCPVCEGSGINPEVIDEAGGWGNWAISVHDHPGPILVVPLD